MRIFYEIQWCPKLSNKILHLMAVWVSLTLNQISSVGVYKVQVLQYIVLRSLCIQFSSITSGKDYKQLVFIKDIIELI